MRDQGALVPPIFLFWETDPPIILDHCRFYGRLRITLRFMFLNIIIIVLLLLLQLAHHPIKDSRRGLVLAIIIIE